MELRIRECQRPCLAHYMIQSDDIITIADIYLKTSTGKVYFYTPPGVPVYSILNLEGID